MNYTQSLNVVKNFVKHDDETSICLVQAFAETQDIEKAIEIVAEQYLAAAQGVSDFNMEVAEYIFAILDEQSKIANAETYGEAAAAELDGFFWVDGLEKWIKLQF